MNGEIRVGEMFAGIGGFRLGLERANSSRQYLQEQRKDGGCFEPRGDSRNSKRQSYFSVVWANEWDKYACQIYRKNYGNAELVEGDIREVKAKDIPDFDLLTTGFPCQSFSLAGKRKGTGESRGTLFAQIVRVASAKRPSLLLLENVKGLLSSDNGRDFAIILRALGNLGYLLEWQVLNSKYFGVPQNRERVFIIGHLGEGCAKQIFPVECDGEEDNGVGEVAGTLQGGGHSGGLHSNMTAIVDFNQDGNTYIKKESSALRSPKANRSNLLIHCHWPRQGNPKEGGTGPLFSDKTVFALDRSPQHLIKNSKIRRLTPIECERLQGFPDGWTEGVSDTQRYKMLGNAVTVNVVEFLGRLILSQKVSSEATT